MPHNPHADFTPTLKGYSGQEPFRFWCQLALPLTYDDSLSYYELLNKVVNYLNHTIEDVSNMESNVGELHNAYVQLQNYVNDYFDNIDIEAELKNVLDKMALDGSLDALLDPLVANHLPEIVEAQIDNVVAGQIDGSVEGQIGDVVAEQLPPIVDENIPEEVSNWLERHIHYPEPGEAVAVDDTLTVEHAAADAKVTGDNIRELKTQIDLVIEDVDSLYKAATYGNENYWYLGGSGNQLQANTEYILRIMPNANFTLDSLQIGSSASAGGMVDTIATNISFTSGVQYEVAYTPSVSDLRWIRMVSSAAKVTSVAFYQVYQRSKAVLIESQTLSTDEKTQARTNIGAAAETEVDEINERIGNVFDTFESVTTAEYTKSGYYINASGQVATSTNFETKKYELPDNCISVTVKTVLYGSAKIVLTDVDTNSADFTSTSFADGVFYPVGNPESAVTYETTFDTNGKGFLYIPHYVGDSTVGIVITAKIAGDISKINASLDQKITAAGSYLKPIVDPENLFDPSDATTGSRLLNKNDETTTDENYGYSDYIDIEGIGYTLEGASTANLCVLYNSSKVGLVSGTISKYADISVRPEGTKYIRFNFSVSALNSLEFKKVTYETVKYITPEQISGGETNIRVGSNETYTSIKAAVDYANSVANKNNIVNILITPGTYDIIGDFDLSEQSASWVGLTLGDYVNLIGIGSPEDIILEGELPSDISSYAFTRNNVSTINAWKNNKLKNLTITAKNMRYCWHNEDGKIYAVEDAVEVVENCVFVYYENDSGVDSTSSVPIGTGASLGRKTTFKDCTFDNQSTTGGYAVLIHNNTTTTKYCEWNFESCDFIGGANNSLKLSSAGSGQTELVNIKGCRLPKSFRFDRQNVYTGTACEYKVYGYGNSISGTVSWDGVTESADVLDMLLS